MFECFPIGDYRPPVLAKFDPRGMIGTIYNGEYQTLLHTKYRSSGPSGFREKDFFSFFSHCKSMRAICCHENHNFDQSGRKTYAVNPPTQ